MFDVVCIGAATEDIFFFSDQFDVGNRHLSLPWGEKITVERMERRLGGGAFNASVSLSRLGLKTAFFGRVGDDSAGRSIKDFLKGEGAATDLLVVDPTIETPTSALLSSGGERTIVMCRGTSDNLLETNPNWEEILDCSWVFLSELAGTNHDFIFELVKNIKKRGIRLSYIPGQRELDLGIKLGSILEQADILVCNGYEAERILGRGGSPEKTLRAFKDLGVGIPVITLGPKGSFAYDGKEVYRQGADPKVKVIDRTGAGDAFSATFTGGIMLGRSVPESLSMAAKNASSVIAKVGGTDGLLSLPQLEE